MHITIRSSLTTLVILLVVAALGYGGQHAGTNTEIVIGKRGVLHFMDSVKAGDVILPPGMYVVEHVVDGPEHVVVFTQLSMEGAAQKHIFMPNENDPGTERARVKCSVEPVAKKWGRTRLILRTNASGEKEVTEVRIRGEAVIHRL
jgi:hypothetical protein